MAEALFGCVCTVKESDRNIVLRWFTDPVVREAYPAEERDHYSRVHVADLRAAVGRRKNDPVAAALVERLRAASEEFAALWELHEVAVRRGSRMRVIHPSLGPIEFDCETLLTPTEDQHLEVFTPPPGSGGTDYLELLRVLGPEHLHAAPRSP
jgi:hypothetical protein